MQCSIYPTCPTAEQALSTTWHGSTVLPPFFFSLYTEGEHLVFHARREAPAIVHPLAQPGEYREELWRYDVVELFIATPDASRYLEFNLSPNGAWWAAGFSAPRVPLPGFSAGHLDVRTRAAYSPERWQAEARIHLAEPAEWGWRPDACRMAVCAVICRDGRYTYLTTCEQRQGQPDFHHPWDWEAAQLA